MDRPLALVVDADPVARSLTSRLLEEQGLASAEAGDRTSALKILRARPVRILVCRRDPEEGADAEFLERARRIRPAIVPILTAEEGDPVAADPSRAGAFDGIAIPPDPREVAASVRRALAHQAILEERLRLREEVRARAGYHGIVGRSEAMEQLREKLERLAAGEVRVLFTGEHGTGKRLAARALHDLSLRREDPFLELDCASEPAELLAGELLGDRRQGEAGAGRRGPGALEAGWRGTLLLHEVTGIPLPLQERLETALGEGWPGAERSGAWVLSTSTGDVGQAVRDGRFRGDLLRQIAPITVAIPPLRERTEDIPLLARHFLEEIREANDLPPIRIEPDALARLARYRWGGNARELRNAIEHAVILSGEGTIGPDDLPERIRSVAEPRGARVSSTQRFRDAKRRVVDSFEKSYLEDLLGRHRGNVTAAAHDAGMLRSALQRLLRKHDLRSTEFRRLGDERDL